MKKMKHLSNAIFLPPCLCAMLFFTTLVVGTFNSTAAAEKSIPNVLFIVIDDMNDWSTLFNKDNPIKTPNLERLAARGMFFDHAYCVVPACNPSRAAVLTGYSPETTQCFDNGVGRPWFKTVPDAVTLPQYFRNNGYMAKSFDDTEGK